MNDKNDSVTVVQVVSKGFFGPLRGWERGLLLLAAGFAAIALLVLGYLTSEGVDHFGSDFLTFDEEIGAVGSVMSGLAGALFAFASSILFFVALMVQLRDHRQSIVEMEKTTANHAQALLIAKQEKEFNVCLQAVQAVVKEYDEFKFQGSSRQAAITAMLDDWILQVSPDRIEDANELGGSLFYHLRYVEDVFPGYNELHELNVHMYWSLNAIQRKALAKDDRRYLETLITPVIRSVGKAQGPRLHSISAMMDEILSRTDEEISLLKVNRDVLKSYREKLLWILSTAQNEVAASNEAQDQAW